jgi:hypothetical protein
MTEPVFDGELVITGSLEVVSPEPEEVEEWQSEDTPSTS